jgi:hypothetical protein
LSLRVNELRRLETSLANVEKGFNMHKEQGQISVTEAAAGLLKLEKYLLLGLSTSSPQRLSGGGGGGGGGGLQLVLGSEGCDILAECSNAIRKLENLFSSSHARSFNANGGDKSIGESSPSSSSNRASSSHLKDNEPMHSSSNRGELLREYERVVRQLRSEIDNDKVEINRLVRVIML